MSGGAAAFGSLFGVRQFAFSKPGKWTVPAFLTLCAMPRFPQSRRSNGNNIQASMNLARTDRIHRLSTYDRFIDLEIKVTNLWPNRLIGDEVLCKPDREWVAHPHRGSFEYSIKEIPQWVKDGKPSPTGRRTFTTWRHWTKDDKPLPSGLIGPVFIRFGETEKAQQQLMQRKVRTVK